MREVPEISVRQVRQSLRLSQVQFAERFCLTLGVLRQWEQGRRRPDKAARVLISVIAHSPEIVDLAITQPTLLAGF